MTHKASSAKKLSVIFFVSLLSSTSVFAEDKASMPKAGTDGAPIEVLVTASRGAEQSALDVAQSTDVVSKDTIGNSEYSDVDDIVRELPNLSMAPAEGNPNFWQEGFTIRGLGAQRVLTLSDGVRQAGQGIGYGGGNLSLYDPYGIERIEVLRGPASVLYGTDAFGGVINVITREPMKRDESGYNSGLRYGYDGSSNLNRVSGYIDAGDKNYAALLSTSVYNSDRPNLKDDEDPNQGSYRGFGLNGKIDFFLEGGTKLRILGNVNDNRDILVDDEMMVLPIANFPPPGSMTMIPSPLYFTFPKYQRSMAGVELSKENISETLKLLKTGIYWQQIARVFHRESSFYSNGSPGFAGPPLFVDPTATVTKSTVDTNDHTNTFEWQSQARYVLEKLHTLVSGLDFGYDTTNDPETETQQVLGIAGVGAVETLPTKEFRVRANANQYRVGAYTQDTWNLSPVDVMPGVRFDYYTVNDDLSEFDDSEFGVSGSIGTVYHVRSNQSVYLNLNTGFRAADLGERFQDGIVNLGAPSRIIGQADLDPERAWNVELGTKHRAGRFSVDVAAFGTKVNNYIGTQNIGVVDGFFTEQYSNVGDVSLYGGESSINFEATDNLRLYINGGKTWTNSGEKVDVPAWAFNYGVKYVQPVNVEYIRTITPALNFRTLGKSHDETVSPNKPTFDGDGFTVADLLLNIDMGKTAFGNGKIVSGIKNLFNKTYKEPFFNVHQPERSGYIAVEFNF